MRVPASWRLLYRDGEEWKPVELSGAYGVERDKYNRVAFKSVHQCSEQAQASVSMGIQEWKVK